MKTITFYFRLSALAIGVFFSTLSYAQQIKDVFVLVDQSGTMSNSTVNNEAKQIIGDMITGQLSLSDWESKGWKNVSAAGNFFKNTSSQMVKNGGVMCIIPFGNMDRVKNYLMAPYNDKSSAQLFISDNFPKTFNDNFTYLDLAKAYAVHIAANLEIKGHVNMIIYTDGMGDHAKENKYPSDLQVIRDSYCTPKMSSLLLRKGILRKETSILNYDIEVWEVGPVPDIPPVRDTTIKPRKIDEPRPQKITITEPRDGEYKEDVVSWEKGEEHSIKWKGSTGTVSVNVQRKEAGDKYSNIPNKERKDCYKVTFGTNAAKIKFFESGDYHIIVADSKGRDERYVTVKTDPPFFTILMIILAVIGGIIVYKIIAKPKILEPGPVINDGWEAKHGNNGSDDWD